MLRSTTRRFTQSTVSLGLTHKDPNHKNYINKFHLPLINNVQIDYQALNQHNEGFLIPPTQDQQKIEFESSKTMTEINKKIPLEVHLFEDLPKEKILEAIALAGERLARHEPMINHLNLPLVPPAAIHDTNFYYEDAFGKEKEFGPWTKNNLMKWYIRSFFMTSAVAERGKTNTSALRHSAAALDPISKKVMFVLLGDVAQTPIESLESSAGILPTKTCIAPEIRMGDPVVKTVVNSLLNPILEFTEEQETDAYRSLCELSPAFEKELNDDQRVFRMSLIARHDDLPPALSQQTLTALLCNIMHNSREGNYALVGCTHKWTVHWACSLGMFPVHYQKFQSKKRVEVSDVGLADKISSADGYLSKYDTGSIMMMLKR